tara:strand:- start:174 stop:719 length:546 start_codon:yes stop_codon:yes gene_type:complete
MALIVKINPVGTEPKLPSATITLNAKKTVDGKVLVFDHPEIDIVVDPGKKKITLFPREEITDTTYFIQDNFFKHLSRAGLVKPETIQVGSVHGSMEASYPDSDQFNVFNVVLYSMYKFIQEELGFLDRLKDIEEEFEDSLTKPNEYDSTELGEVPHSRQKGSIRPGYIYSPYGISSIYRFE